jgi:serine/threonine protein kinase
MGEVYRAQDPRLKRSIALKILHAETSSDPARASAPPSNASGRMVREAQLAAALDHPNVVAIFDVGQVEQPEELRGTTYLAMELIRGAPLRKYVGGLFAGMTERDRIVAALDACSGNQTHAAKVLGISRRTLITRIEEYKLPRPRKKDGDVG